MRGDACRRSRRDGGKHRAGTRPHRAACPGAREGNGRAPRHRTAGALQRAATHSLPRSRQSPSRAPRRAHCRTPRSRRMMGEDTRSWRARSGLGAARAPAWRAAAVGAATLPRPRAAP
jgi:hypothetical protein